MPKFRRVAVNATKAERDGKAEARWDASQGMIVDDMQLKYKALEDNPHVEMEYLLGYKSIIRDEQWVQHSRGKLAAVECGYDERKITQFIK